MKSRFYSLANGEHLVVYSAYDGTGIAAYPFALSF